MSNPVNPFSPGAAPAAQPFSTQTETPAPSPAPVQQAEAQQSQPADQAQVTQQVATSTAAEPVQQVTTTAAAPAPAPAPVQQAPAPFGQVASAPVAPSIQEVSFDTEIKFNRLDRFPSMKKDEVARIAFLLKDAEGRPRLRMSQVISDKVGRKTYLAPDNLELRKLMVEKFGDLKPRFVTVIGVYTTNSAGVPLSTDVKVMAYVFGEDKFRDLKTLDQEWKICTRDLLLTCKDENFQKVSFAPASDRLINHIAGLEAKLVEEAIGYFEKQLGMYLGKKHTDDEYRAILAGATPGASMGAPGSSAPANPFGAPSVTAVAPNAASFADLVTRN